MSTLLLDESKGQHDRAKELARELVAYFPQAQFVAYRQNDEQTEGTFAFDRDGAVRSDVADEIDLLIDRSTENESRDGSALNFVAQTPLLRGSHVILASLRFRTFSDGEIAVTIPAEPNLDLSALCNALTGFAADASAQLFYSQADSPVQTLEFTTELAAPVAHECNNFLNIVGLQLALLEREMSGAQLNRLIEIRKHANALKGLIHRFQSYRHATRSEPENIDLKQCVKECVGELIHNAPSFPQVSLRIAGTRQRRPESMEIAFGFSEEPAIVTCRRNDLDGIVSLLVLGAADHLTAGKLVIRTQPSDETVELLLDEIAAYEGSGYSNWGQDSLEWEAIVALLRNVDGSIERTQISPMQHTTRVTLPTKCANLRSSSSVL